MSSSLFQYLNRLAADRWARAGVRTILRALWLSLCLWCIALGGSLLWGWRLRYELLGSATLAIIGVSVLFLLRRRMTPLEVARRLDRRFHLDEQLATAVEITATREQQSPVAARLLNDSGRTAAQLHRRLIQRRVLPWSDITALLALFIILIGLYVLVAVGRPDDLASASLTPPPPLVQPQDDQLPDEPQQQPGRQSGQQPGGTQASNTPGGADPQTTGALADALREQGATRPAADALDRGDVKGAAQHLRDLADQADQLSKKSRDDLAQRLRQGARNVEGRNQALADQMRQSAKGLEQGGNDAQQAISDLAQAVENLAQPPQTAANGQQPGAQGGQPGAGDQSQQGQQQGTGDQSSQSGQTGQQQGAGAQGSNQSGQGDGQNGTASGAGNSATTGQRQSAPSPRLGVQGQPLELEAQGSGQNAEQKPGQQPSGAISAPGRTTGGGNGQQSSATGADPLRIPVDERDVVQGYFTP